MLNGIDLNIIIKRICVIARSIVKQCDEAIQKTQTFSWISAVLGFCLAPRNAARLEKSCYGATKREKFSHFSLLTSHHSAFTLSEVLITLGIIGVVVAMTLPAIINNIQDAQYKTAYKKAFSAASQAVESASSENLFTFSTYNDDNTVFYKNFLVFMNKFKTVKQCINNNGDKCWSSSGEKAYGEKPESSYYSFLDSSGMSWSMLDYDVDWIVVDTNGFKTPNKWGKDRFAFFMTDNTSGSVAIIRAMILIPTKIKPFPDNDVRLCRSTNECVAKQNYFGTSWLYQ